MKINDLFKMKMIIVNTTLNFMNKTADSIISDHTSESVTAET